MKGFLTFTLAAGVAITTTSVAQAAGAGKVALNPDQAVSAQNPGPMSTGVLNGFTLDRSALNRELSRLATLLEPTDGDEASDTADAPRKRKLGTEWTF